VKLCTKNYENPSIFVKVTAKKSVAPFFLGHCVYTRCDMHKFPGIPAGNFMKANYREFPIPSGLVWYGKTTMA